jgi:hypothetical protein
VSDVLKIKNRYWKLSGTCDQTEAKIRIKNGLRKTNVTAERFITAVNEQVGYQWICDELIATNPEIHDTTTPFMWVVTLSTKKIELKQKLTKHKKCGNPWNTLFSFAISKA